MIVGGRSEKAARRCSAGENSAIAIVFIRIGALRLDLVVML
jgi:hypothetical protein